MAAEIILLQGRNIINRMIGVHQTSLLSNLTKCCAAAGLRGYKKPPSATRPLPSKLQDWRRQRQLPVNPNRRGPLTDGADYSYPDGRPVRAGARQAARAAAQRQLMERIVQLTYEVDLAERLHAERTQRAEQQRQHQLSRRLRTKATETLETEPPAA